MTGDGHGWLIIGGLSLIAVAVVAGLVAARDNRRGHSENSHPDDPSDPSGS